ncbi:hypothetical protein K474DRAFT_1083069 [Panus rudis PR-1116 ss-1]|nr:hypothetical protein K474DRAFT_1083069 [Panus rudis PR-1116 ss-1]
MGKLNIAHHKSYHPYRRDNIERVRRDEEEARKKEAIEKGRMMLADSEARMDLLRQRAGTTGKRSRRNEEEESVPEAGPSTLTAPNGHINFFEDLERQQLPIAIRTSTKKTAEPTDKGVPLAPSEKDLKPWYSDKNHERNRELEDDRKLRDLARKSVHDPLISINSQLSSRTSKDDPVDMRRSRAGVQRRPSSQSGAGGSTSQPPAVAERVHRESSERQRALELIRRKKREMSGSETPSTVYGGREEGYGDLFNKREVEEAHRTRERAWEERQRPRRPYQR